MSQVWDIDTINRTSTSPSSDIDKIVNGFNALRTLFSGSAEPTDIVAYMWWADTANGVLKQRDTTNSNWVIRATLSDDRVIVKTGNYTVVPSDFGKTILCDASSAAFTINLPAAATVGEGFKITFKKIDSSSNGITLDANDSETIDGALTLLLFQRLSSVTLESDGQNWYRHDNLLYGVPISCVLPFASSASPPSGWLLCDGSAVSRTTYANLFAFLGVAWGAGDGSTTFNLPDFRGRTLIGVGAGPGLTNRLLAQIGGSEMHTLAVSELPPHHHRQLMMSQNTGSPSYGHGRNEDESNPIDSALDTMDTGNGSGHNNMQPFAVVNYIIKT